MAFQDKTLTCRDCGNSFAFTAGEQEFYQTRGLLHEPTRCPNCRATRRTQRGDGAGSAPRTMHSAICANCGKETQVPFEPRLGRPVYCNDCFATIGGSTGGGAGGRR
ncbi:MAG: zinc-binding protein [Dehalococcoidia bacterium]|nr:zinc-binding protein [Dehalococcoidia bacterium]